jgi:hypothetical protein
MAQILFIVEPENCIPGSDSGTELKRINDLYIPRYTDAAKHLFVKTSETAGQQFAQGTLFSLCAKTKDIPSIRSMRRMHLNASDVPEFVSKRRPMDTVCVIASQDTFISLIEATVPKQLHFDGVIIKPLLVVSFDPRTGVAVILD